MLLFKADLTEGIYSIEDTIAITVGSDPVPPVAGSETCDMEGSVKITFPVADDGVQNRKLRIDLYFEQQTVPLTGISFHIGDSNLNRGENIPSEELYSAEILGSDNDWEVHANNLPGRAGYTGNAEGTLADFIPSIITDHITILVGDEFVKFDNHNGVMKSYESKYLFSLSGASDYDIFLSMNRAIDPLPGAPPAKGLCNVVVRSLEC